MSMKALLPMAVAVLLCASLCGCSGGNAQTTRRLHAEGDRYDNAAIGLLGLPAYTRLQKVNICVKQQLSVAACNAFRQQNVARIQQLFHDVDHVVDDRLALSHLDPRSEAATLAATRYRDDARRFLNDTARYCDFIAASAGEPSFLRH